MKRHLCLIILLAALMAMVSCSSSAAGASVSGSDVIIDLGSAEPSGSEETDTVGSEPGAGSSESGIGYNSGKKELRAVWISYLELKSFFFSADGFKASVDSAFEKISSAGMNAVIVQVRPFNDAIYPSEIFTWSAIVTGTQGASPGYDPLAYMLDRAHSLSLELHAWINPYRVALKSTDPALLSEDNFARTWMLDGDESNDDWVLESGGGLYLNPAVPQVQQKIVDGIKEIVQKYDVDGIHFDDYFYPTTDEEFDAKAYADYRTTVYGSPLELADWRRANVNAMVSASCAAAKSRQGVVFGISPAADIEKNYSQYYADFAAWMDGGYIDYLMPQIYFGFEHPVERARFDVLLEKWLGFMNGRSTALYIGLAPYKIGASSGDDAAEWSGKDNILEQEILLCRESGSVGGYAFYSYSYLFSDAPLNKTQREKVVSLFKQ
jgi:uncharacterized lipoprotein YddW (UPF0748 family)